MNSRKEKRIMATQTRAERRDRRPNFVIEF